MTKLIATPCDCAEWKRLNEACADLMRERDQAIDSLHARDSLVIASKEKAERERDVLLNALIEIRDSRFCDYENTGQTSYGTGVTDGHRFCSNVAMIAIDAMQEIPNA